MERICSRAARQQPGDGLTSSMTGSSATGFRFCGLVRACCCSPHAYLAWAAGDRHQPSRPVVPPTGSPSSYLEGRQFSTGQRVSTPADAMATALLLLCGPEAQGDFVRMGAAGCLWPFVALHHGAFSLIGFMLRQFEGLARLVGIRPYNAIAFSARSRCS